MAEHGNATERQGAGGSNQDQTGQAPTPGTNLNPAPGTNLNPAPAYGQAANTGQPAAAFHAALSGGKQQDQFKTIKTRLLVMTILVICTLAVAVACLIFQLVGGSRAGMPSGDFGNRANMNAPSGNFPGSGSNANGGSGSSASGSGSNASGGNGSSSSSNGTSGSSSVSNGSTQGSSTSALGGLTTSSAELTAYDPADGYVYTLTS
jgi:hypothetical protein